MKIKPGATKKVYIVNHPLERGKWWCFDYLPPAAQIAEGLAKRHPDHVTEVLESTATFSGRLGWDVHRDSALPASLDLAF